jgi:hypothetical protein
VRKLLFGLGIAFLFIVGAGGTGLYMLAREGGALDAESKAYVQDAVQKIATNWDADELWKRSATGLREHGTKQDLSNFFDAARSALGRMQEFYGAEGQSAVLVTPSGKSTTARYDAKVHFEKGDADIIVTAVKSTSGWQIEGFHINSTALMRTLVGARS